MVAVPRHGHAQRANRTSEYSAWLAMIARCTNPRCPSYRWYGGRGISVASVWRGKRGFDAFIKAIGLKPDPWATLERIDNARGYEPGNVCWASRREQSRNRTLNRRITIKGETLCVSDWAERLGVRRGMIFNRLGRGWDPVAAVLTPSSKGRNR